MNYDEIILGCGNSQHPANQIETSEPETEKLSITAKFEALEASNFEADQCSNFYLELAEIEKKRQISTISQWRLKGLMLGRML